MSATILNGLEFRIPFVPGSKKNNYKPRKQVPFRARNGKYHGRPVYSALAKQEGALRAFLAAEMSRRGLRPLPKDQAVSVELAVHEGPKPSDCYLALYVFSLGKRQRSGRPGRPCDLDGILTTVLDAMQRSVFTDDLQVTKLAAVRRVGGEPAEPWIPTASELAREAGR